MQKSSRESSGKTYVLLVGASSAIGCEVIRQISDDNTVMLAHCHSGVDRLNSIREEIRGEIVPIPTDLATNEGVEALITSVEQQCQVPGKIVFLAAPVVSLKRFKDLRWEDFEEQLDIQLAATVQILVRFLPAMALARYGRIVFVLSSYTRGRPPSALAHYVTAKYAVLGLMKCLAAEYAEKKVCINAIAPSMVETPFISQIPSKLVELTAQAHPLKRNAHPADIAPLVKFLLSDEAAYITGVNIPITGGG